MNEYSHILCGLKEENRLRALPPDGTEGLIDLTSNDYLGLAARQPDFEEEFWRRFKGVPFTSSASRLLSSRQRWHYELEGFLRHLYGKEALLFNSGYHANAGIISALNLPGTLFLADRLCHASMIDGLVLGKCNFKRFRHNDADHLEMLLSRHAGEFSQIIVMTESVFSMDGDLAPLMQIIELKQKYGFMLYLDEAHGLGVMGSTGLGLASEYGVLEEVDILIGTFGKALASSGAFAATSPMMRDYLLNTARSFIFSTALPPVNAAWTLLMLEKTVDMAGERKRLLKMATRLRLTLSEITCIEVASRSQIVPLMAGSAENALTMAASLREAGIMALPIRRPTVPPGEERLRLSLSAALSDAELDFVLHTLKRSPLFKKR